MSARRALLAAIVVAAIVLALSGTRQASPNTIRVVIDQQRSFCTDDGRWFATGQTGWLPTVNCLFPPPVPQVRR
jgi:hypothetical protein